MNNGTNSESYHACMSSNQGIFDEVTTFSQGSFSGTWYCNNSKYLGISLGLLLIELISMY